MSGAKTRVVIHTTSPMQSLSPQTLRENEILAERVRKWGSLFRQVTEFLEDQANRRKVKLTRDVMLELAGEMVATLGCPRIDRIAYRQKQGILCWFCENFQDLMQFLNQQARRHKPPCATAVPIPTLSPPQEANPLLCEEFEPSTLTWGDRGAEDFFDW
jgi:hypothetical protein